MNRFKLLIRIFYNLLFVALNILSFEFLRLQLPVYPLDGRSIKRNGSGRQIGDIVGFQCQIVFFRVRLGQHKRLVRLPVGIQIGK